MIVSDMLAEKGRNVITTGGNTTLEETAGILAGRKIGAVIIEDESGQVCGILSERDIVREISRSGADALKAEVSECMTKKVVSCKSEDTVGSIMEKMTAGKFRHIPVIDDGKLSGIISIGDVVKRKIEQAEREAKK